MRPARRHRELAVPTPGLRPRARRSERDRAARRSPAPPELLGAGKRLRHAARARIEDQGLLVEGQSFPQYCVQLARAGWINGWYLPFVHEDHMDDPRSPNTHLHDDADLIAHLPLSARRQGVSTLADWEASIRRSARECQAASLDPRDFEGWRLRRRRLGRRLGRLVGRGRQW
ncbi:MAG: hypothetical protein U5R31_15735 [Acidimicrobiia bacterium]|nr:hypothetical protein [Acidimicrobiia bacterium]